MGNRMSIRLTLEQREQAEELLPALLERPEEYAALIISQAATLLLWSDLLEEASQWLSIAGRDTLADRINAALHEEWKSALPGAPHE